MPDKEVSILPDAMLRSKYTSLFNSISQGFCIIEMIWNRYGQPVDYRFVEVNPAFQKQTGIVEYSGRTMKEINPAHENHWFRIYGEIARTGQPAHFELPAKLINGWYEVEAFPIPELGYGMIGILFNDITSRKKAEEILRKSEERQAYLLKLTDGIRFLSDPAAIQMVALKALVQYLNADIAFYGDVVTLQDEDYIQAERLYQKDGAAPFYPGYYAFSLFGKEIHMLKQKKTAMLSRMQKVHPARGKGMPGFCAWAAVPLIRKDQQMAVLMVQYTHLHVWTDEEISIIEETAERTWSYIEREKVTQALNQSQDQLSVALAASNMSTFHWLSKDGKITVSPLSPNVFGLKSPELPGEDTEGFHLIHPEDQEKHRKTLEAASRTQEEFHHVYRIIRPVDGQVAWIEERGKGIHHPDSSILEVRGIHWDVTGKKNEADRLREADEKYLAKLEKDVETRTRALKDSRDELAAIYNNTLMAISVLNAVRDKNNQIIDFKIALVNNALEKETGRTDLIGKRYAKEYPGIKKTGLFDKMLSVMESGIPVTTEYFYPYEDFNKWYSCMFVKMGDSLLATNLDISERKIAEKLFKENSAMIEGIANSAPDMLYAIHLGTLQQFYSNYRIEQLVAKTQPEIRKMGRDFFEQFVHPDDKRNFYAHLDELRAGIQKETRSLIYRLIDAEGKIHWISTKSSVYIRDKEGMPTHIVGISQDITQQKELEEKNRQLTRERRELERKQQKEILKATLNALEEERTRIAESLHNGLGQVLYGVKTTLEQLKLQDVTPQRQLMEILHKAKGLLGMCIQESRKIAHELMPSILEDFGLKAGIKDICTQLKGKTHFNCTFSGIDISLEKYLQLAIYRIVQELALNIVKHAQASIAHVHIAVAEEEMHIKVRDNGIGFENTVKKEKGIGLKTIESKVKLLNGTMTITSSPHQTVIHIQFPL